VRSTCRFLMSILARTMWGNNVIVYDTAFPQGRLIVLKNNEIHFQPYELPMRASMSLVREFRRLVRAYGTLYTRHSIHDKRTPKLNAALGFREVRRDFVFVYYAL
jgi:hypothetical protein